MFVDRAERKENIKVIKGVLDVLNHIDTSVEKQDNKYIVAQNNDKKYEITVNPEDTVIRAFDNGKPGILRVVWKEGMNVKAKLWLLKFELEDRTEPKLFETTINKVKTFKSNIDIINWHLTIIDQPDARVSVENETPVTKIYSIKFKSCGAECQKSVEFDGSITNFFQSVDIRNYGLRSIESSGYLGWKLGVLRRDLDKKLKQQVKAAAKEEKIKMKGDLCFRIKCDLADLMLGRGNKR